MYIHFINLLLNSYFCISYIWIHSYAESNAKRRETFWLLFWTQCKGDPIQNPARSAWDYLRVCLGKLQSRSYTARSEMKFSFSGASWDWKTEMRTIRIPYFSAQKFFLALAGSDWGIFDWWDSFLIGGTIFERGCFAPDTIFKQKQHKRQWFPDPLAHLIEKQNNAITGILFWSAKQFLEHIVPC